MATTNSIGGTNVGVSKSSTVQDAKERLINLRNNAGANNADKVFAIINDDTNQVFAEGAKKLDTRA